MVRLDYRLLPGGETDMTRSGIAALAIVAVTAMAPAGSAFAQTAAKAPAKAEAQTLDPAAWAAVEAMGKYLRTLKSFDVTATGSTEEVADNGQKLNMDGTLTYAVTMPDKLFLETTSDRAQRRYFYDGKTVAIEIPRINMYTDAPLPGTINTLLTTADAKFGIDLPLQDLFVFGTPAAAKPTSGARIGPARIGDTDTTHYAFRQPGVDWQIWIADGAKPLPMKIVMTSTLNAARPQYQARLTWNTDAAHGADRFTYVPAKGAARIALATNEGTTK
jgi:hypothetical protein